MRRSYARSQYALGALLAGLGLAMLATTATAGGGPLSLGTLVGVSFTALGVARIWIARQAPAEPRR